MNITSYIGFQTHLQKRYSLSKLQRTLDAFDADLLEFTEH